ncbi:MAG TPA: hypothetical protein DCP28_29610, partial [Cytophagales bacterium]|nr:hypothetical protein [Cytophagales bacterium]
GPKGDKGPEGPAGADQVRVVIDPPVYQNPGTTGGNGGGGAQNNATPDPTDNSRIQKPGTIEVTTNGGNKEEGNPTTPQHAVVTPLPQAKTAQEEPGKPEPAPENHEAQP